MSDELLYSYLGHVGFNEETVMTADAKLLNEAATLAMEINLERAKPHNFDPFLNRLSLALTDRQWEIIVKALKGDLYVHSGQWIATAERMPTESTIYIVSDVDKQLGFAWFEDGHFVHTPDSDLGEIAEWAPLPAERTHISGGS